MIKELQTAEDGGPKTHAVALKTSLSPYLSLVC